MNIPISKEGGLEPHLMFFPRCGGEYNGLTVGVLYEATLSNGMKSYFMRGQKGKLVRMLKEKDQNLFIKKVRHVEEGEKVPASEPCDKCRAEMEEHAKIVSEGGVYFSCKECGASGVIRPCAFARYVRAVTGVEAPNPVGIDFEACKEHEV